MFHCGFSTAIGLCRLRWTDAGITGFCLPSPVAAESAVSPPLHLQGLVQRVQRHLSGIVEDFADAPFAFDGVSVFQRQVYVATLEVKAGRTHSYGDLARALGLPPGGARAVAAALGSNPWPLLVPCHRIVGSNGEMTGFSAPGGVAMKARLLALEGAQLL